MRFNDKINVQNVFVLMVKAMLVDGRPKERVEID